LGKQENNDTVEEDQGERTMSMVTPMKMVMQNWWWQPRKRRKFRKEKFSGKPLKSTRRLCCLVSEVAGAPRTETNYRKLSPKCH